TFPPGLFGSRNADGRSSGLESGRSEADLAPPQPDASSARASPPQVRRERTAAGPQLRVSRSGRQAEALRAQSEAVRGARPRSRRRDLVTSPAPRRLFALVPRGAEGRGAGERSAAGREGDLARPGREPQAHP